ncbi:MAG: protein kinase [Myxococcales bacterium]|nr:protein kinase [Myxococcales bacterium]
MAKAGVEIEKTLAAAHEPVAAFTPGLLFAGRYVIEKLLGEGGMGAVYRVHDREVDERVALKLLLGASTSAEAVERFRREVRLARRVTHRNAARTYDLGEHDGLRFLTMEYVDGKSLRQVLQHKGTLEHGCAASVAAEICAGLAAAHEAGVIHRDLKPANILVERGGHRIVITDFGIARALAGREGTQQTTGLMGTPAYMAPEQVSSGAIDHRTDLYAVSLILYEMITGELPFDGDNPIAMALARLRDPPPDLRERADVPEGLAELVRRGLAIDPSERPSSASEMAAALVPFADDKAAASSTLGPLVTLYRTQQTTSRPDLSLGTATTPRSTTPRWTVAAPSGERALAVLPFRHRGPESERYIAETLTDELIDLLSRTRGLKVSGSGATAKYADTGGRDRDPRSIGRDLGVDVIVDGTVQVAGKRIRISARLEDVSSGFQLWSERFDGALEDVFELQDRMARRIAEALRVELSTIAHRGEAPAEAIELYLRARQIMRSFRRDIHERPVDMLEKSLALAPEFKPAIAAHAIACLQAWFIPELNDSDWQTRARDSVARALAAAPELAETHFAAAKFAVQIGEYRDAARSLAQALKIAPTFAEGHDYLGRLQCEAGRSEQGIGHIRLALDLDPSLVSGYFDIARYHGLNGDFEAVEKIIETYKESAVHGGDPGVPLVEVRIAGWQRDFDRIRRCLADIESRKGRPAWMIVTLLCRGYLGLVDPVELLRFLDSTAKEATLNPRFTSVSYQLAAEVAAARGLHDDAMDYISRAANGVLVDIDWLDRCPVLEGLRGRPEYEAARAKVKRRAEAIWTI